MGESSRRLAVISASDKRNLVPFCRELLTYNYRFLGTAGTCALLRQHDVASTEIGAYTEVSEMLGGRVKTLHPKIYAGILAKDDPRHREELESLGYGLIDLVICNLYPFQQTVAKEGVTEEEVIENIDIGGVTLLRAAAKNFGRVTVVCDPDDYQKVLWEMRSNEGAVGEDLRKRCAMRAFCLTAEYDDAISSHFRERFSTPREQLTLRYGVNPHQVPARVYTPTLDLPFTVLNGSPGFINLCDALNAWQLVEELKRALALPSAASFKHVSPAGAAVGLPLSETEAKVFLVDDAPTAMTPLSCAFARARGADRLSSFGDFVALSDPCDLATARLLAREVSDGVIAPGYLPDALEVLRKKKDGRYCILQINENYRPPLMERRTLFGVTFEQRRNDAIVDHDLFRTPDNVVHLSSELTEEAIRDLIIATVAVKYTQSNSVCLAKGGQVIGVGAGQQSRIHCTRIACNKADAWWLRHHPKVLELQASLKSQKRTRTEIDHALSDAIEDPDGRGGALDAGEKREMLHRLTGVCLSSDAFFPFGDSIQRASKSGVQYVASPGGSSRDAVVAECCRENDITLLHTGIRLFHH